MYPKIAQFKNPAAFAARLVELGLDLPLDERVLSAAEGSPLAQELCIANLRCGNRWCIHPMEGWDANRDGSPSEHTIRRWQRFGTSGAKLIWGGEAAAVTQDGRANPRQTLATIENKSGLATLLAELQAAHSSRFGVADDLVVGLQLTHSGRFSRPNSSKLEPKIAYHHPLLDVRFEIDRHDQSIVWSDKQLDQLVDRFVEAAQIAWEVGFQFVDIKACHGYLLHEFLSAYSRPGSYGGDLEGRSRLLVTIVDQVRKTCPGLAIGVRLSAFDTVPYQPGLEVGRPMPYLAHLPYRYAFGTRHDDPLTPDLTESVQLMSELARRGVTIFNLSAGSPYYCPHIQRPAIFPPSDGYQPPEDPLVGVARQIHATRELKRRLPGLIMVGTGYSYLQDYLPLVAQAVVRQGWVDAVGIGRMALSYPDMPADTLAGRAIARKLVCRTFSDCTSAPRNGLVSGCFPLDSYYKDLTESDTLKRLKSAGSPTSMTADEP